MWAWLASSVFASEVRTEPRAPGLPYDEWLLEERVASEQLEGTRCGRRSSVWPGVWQLCTGRKVEGGLLLGVSAAEAVAGVAVLVATKDDPSLQSGFDSGRTTLLLAATEPMVYSAFDALLVTQRARGLAYVPLESGAELWSAPFRPKILARPNVLFGTLALVGGAIALQSATDGRSAPTFDRPNVLGAHPPGALGYPALAVLGGGFMLQVATAEEIVFRGYVQSGLTRSTGEVGGVVLGSLLFGAIHAPNALLLEPEDRVPYLLYSVPYITLTGSWLSWTYHREGYRLAPTIAQHFWYNVAVSTAGALFDPEHHLFSLRVGGAL